MEDVYALRHKVFVEGKSQRQVAREMGLARQPVRRWLATALPEPRKRKRSRPVLEQVRPRLEQLLEEWSERTTAKQRITGRRLHRALREEGYEIGLSLVLEYLRKSSSLPLCGVAVISRKWRVSPDSSWTRRWRLV